MIAGQGQNAAAKTLQAVICFGFSSGSDEPISNRGCGASHSVDGRGEIGSKACLGGGRWIGRWEFRPAVFRCKMLVIDTLC